VVATGFFVPYEVTFRDDPVATAPGSDKKPVATAVLIRSRSLTLAVLTRTQSLPLPVLISGVRGLRDRMISRGFTRIARIRISGKLSYPCHPR